MKHTYTLFCFLLFSFSCFCQTGDFTLTFEDTTVINQVYYTDNLLDPVGIWQIGKPNKAFFDSAYNSDKAVVTGLDSTLPANTRASFIIKVPDLGASPVENLLMFTHKFDFDSVKSGGIVEFSVNEGIDWYPVFNRDSFDIWYNPELCITGVYPGHADAPSPVLMGLQQHNVTSNGIPYFTGIDSLWAIDTIAFPQTAFYGKNNDDYHLWFRFTAFADSLASPAHAGWIIDNISYIPHAFFCPGGINEINSSHLRISPNPAQEAFIISLTDETNSDHSITLYDLTSREMMRREFSGSQVTIQRSGLAAGSYIVKVTNVRRQDTFEKRVVFE